MTAEAIENLALSTLSDFSQSVVAILLVIINVGVAYLVFRFGWRQVKASLGNIQAIRNRRS